MNTRPLVAALAVLVLLGAAAPLANTQASEVGEGVEIQPTDGPNGAYAQVGPDGQVTIQLDGDASVPGEGLPADTKLDFDRVFQILNANNAGNAEGRQAYVYVVDEGAGVDSVDLYRGTDTDNSIEGEADAVRLDTGESATVGFTVDTSDDDLGKGDPTFTVEVDVSEIARATLNVVTENPTAGQPVEFDATESTGDRREYTYDFGDGTIAADAAPQENHIFAEPGTYDVTLTVEETAPRAPDGSDSDRTTIVVSGPSQTGGSGETITIPNAVPGSDRPAIRSITADLAGGASDDVTVRALDAESAADAAGGNAPQGSPVAAMDISVPTNPDVDATLTAEIDASAVPSGTPASDLALERYNGMEWETLPTAVESTGGGTITLVAETPGFSSFAATVNPDAPTLDRGVGGGSDDDNTDDPADTATPTATPPADTATPTATPPADTATPTATPPADTATPTATPPADTATPTATPPADTATPATTEPPTEPGGVDLTTVLVAVALLVAAAVVLFVRYRDEWDPLERR